MLFKLSNLNSHLAITLGYLNPAVNTSYFTAVLAFEHDGGNEKQLVSVRANDAHKYIDWFNFIFILFKL